MRRKELTEETRKVVVLTHYGNGKCACVRCGVDDVRVLCIDHINDDGKEHRAKIGGGGRHIYKWLVENNYPEGFQTLCMNCNWLKRCEHLPFNNLKKLKYTKRVRKWIELTDTRFHYEDIRKALALNEKESRNLRFLIHRMYKKGELVKVGPWQGCYKKVAKPVKVFG